MQTCVLGLTKRDIHDLASDALDLDVHLQRRDACIGTGNLEVHVAEVVFVTEDVGQDGEVFTFFDETHGNTGNRRINRDTPASISDRLVPQTEAIELEPFDSVISETTRMT